VFDPVGPAARSLAEQHGGTASATPEDLWTADDVDAVIVASPTQTHVAFTLASLAAGKPVLCEKPISVDVAEAATTASIVAGQKLPVQLALNRRHDPSYRALRDALRSGEVGSVRQVFITNRDAEPASLDYLRVSGGIFRDCTIHDFDMARWLLGEPIESVFADGACLVDPAIGATGDFDTTLVILRSPTGRTVSINNCRQASYGNDQRIEVFGSAGMLQVGNLRATSLSRYSSTHTDAKDPLLHFFPERYEKSYVAQIEAFSAAVLHGAAVEATFDDGVAALQLADAALKSAVTGTRVFLREIDQCRRIDRSRNQ
jgi:myo-inositol 2-dehydrogenase/D-chiro-inositol 1-dehydrogenase